MTQRLVNQSEGRIKASSLQKKSTSDADKIKPQYMHMLIGATFVMFFLYIFAQLLESSALITILVFNILSIILTFPLKGPLWCKIAWLGMGNLMGVVWNLVRSSLITVATGIETQTFSLTIFVLGPVTDFIWLVPVWSLGISALSSLEHHKRR